MKLMSTCKDLVLREHTAIVASLSLDDALHLRDLFKGCTMVVDLNGIGNLLLL
jgi:hypothetical protein